MKMKKRGDPDKSYVGLEHCYFCNEAKGVVLDRRLRDSLPRAAVYNKEPCDTCAGHMRAGIILISVSDKRTTDQTNPYRSGGWVVLTEEAVTRIFDPTMTATLKKHRAGFLTDEAWMQLGLPYGDVTAEDEHYAPPTG